MSEARFGECRGCGNYSDIRWGQCIRCSSGLGNGQSKIENKMATTINVSDVSEGLKKENKELEKTLRTLVSENNKMREALKKISNQEYRINSNDSSDLLWAYIIAEQALGAEQ